jgi:lactoylglutathione lyase
VSGGDDRILGIWHFSFTVSDLDRSVAFYRDLLGLELVHVQEQDNAYTRSLVGYRDAALRVAQFAIPGAGPGASTHHLELVEYRSPRMEPGDGEIARPGAAHLAIAVADIAGWHRRLTAAGVEFFSAPNSITAGINIGGWAVYLRDPDRNVLELLQPPPRPI